jgi:hypothetical protein
LKALSLARSLSLSREHRGHRENLEKKLVLLVEPKKRSLLLYAVSAGSARNRILKALALARSVSLSREHRGRGENLEKKLVLLFEPI